MKNLLLYSLLAVTMLIATALRSAEIIPVWNKTINGDVQDIKFMPGNGDQFMLTTGLGEIQIRNSENGELIKSHIDSSQFFMNGYFEFTPDSNRLVMAKSGLLQLVDLKTFERLNYFAFGNDSIAKGFKYIVLDPVKPYAFVIVSGWEKTSGKDETRSKVQVYNYETMQLVKDLTEYGIYEYSAIAVSDDGKYLATLNNGKAYLKVWDLETMEQIRNVQLWDDKLPEDEYWCESKDIQFSKLNSDVIFYSGLFPMSKPKVVQAGLRKFTIGSEIISDDITKSGYSGKILLFDNEIRSLTYSSLFLYFYNFNNKTFDRYYKSTNIYPGGKTIFNKINNFFIGFEGSNFCKFLYDRESNLELKNTEEIIISPNPTNSFVNIQLNCTEPQISYQINNSNGILLLQNTMPNQGSNLQIDFSLYPTGVYFLTFQCSNQPKTYKIIKEG